MPAKECLLLYEAMLIIRCCFWLESQVMPVTDLMSLKVNYLKFMYSDSYLGLGFRILLVWSRI